MKWTERFKQFISENASFYKPTLLVGMFIGAIYLNGYLSQFGIPFPLDIGVLPTALLVIGFLSVGLLLILAIYVLLVGFINIDPFSADIHRLINTEKSGLYAPKKRNTLYYAFFSYIFPFTVFLIIVVYYPLGSGVWNQALLFLGFGVWATIYALLVSCKSAKRPMDFAKSTFKIAAHVFFVQIISIMSLAVFIAIIAPRVKGITDLQFISVLAGFLLVNTACIFPAFSLKKFSDAHDAQDSLSADELIKKSHMYPTYLIVAILLVISLLPPFSPYVGQIPLRILNLGGGIEFTAKDDTRQCNAWPKFIIEKSEDSSCATKKGELIIQLGDRAYATFENESSEKILVSLNLSKSAIMRTLPEDSRFK